MAKWIDYPVDERRALVDNDYQLTIKTVSPARTFLEKAFLLNEEFQKDHPRTGKMSRHLYDLEKLSKTAYGAQALSDGKLYKEIVNHREKFYHPGYVDYNKDLPDAIAFVPTGELAESFKTDYVSMCGSFIYEKDPLSFEELLEKLKAIQELFRQVKVLVADFNLYGADFGQEHTGGRE